jgi:cupin superfamily acireductone dioxygenase involved in methionine salvage
MELKITPWPGNVAPTVQDVQDELQEQELDAYSWSSLPEDTFEGHTHGYHKVLYVVAGSIKFEFPARHESLTLRAGDRLDLPSGIRHNAVVGIDGVTCLEAHII